jgi:hypothetical protein
MLCQSESNLLPGPCTSQGRWVGPDDKVRCSLHHIQEFGYGERLVRVEGYTPPKGKKPPVSKQAKGNGREVTDTKRQTTKR